MAACSFVVVFLLTLCIEIYKDWNNGEPITTSTPDDDNSTMYMYFASEEL